VYTGGLNLTDGGFLLFHSHLTAQNIVPSGLTYLLATKSLSLMTALMGNLKIEKYSWYSFTSVRKEASPRGSCPL
jgi:hypothetical protein